jgi:hypothetical protein
MGDVVSTALIEAIHGRVFGDRVQRVMTACAMWRRELVTEMSAAGVDEVELDSLQLEMSECLKIIKKLSRSAEKLKREREGQ